MRRCSVDFLVMLIQFTILIPQLKKYVQLEYFAESWRLKDSWYQSDLWIPPPVIANMKRTMLIICSYFAYHSKVEIYTDFFLLTLFILIVQCFTGKSKIFVSFYHLQYSDYYLLRYIHNVSANASFGLLQVFHVEHGSPHRTLNQTLHLIHGIRWF